jgi:hypothetical protein
MEPVVAAGLSNHPIKSFQLKNPSLKGSHPAATSDIKALHQRPWIPKAR